jgi:tetratricopeptide (TPR) repeat protein
VELDIDILLIGNLNLDVQYKRAPLLRRISSLSPRYNVVIATGVHGDDYTSLMNRAKIVFNHSIRGEANMRAFEGPACGALTFNEVGNCEISTVFVNGKTHVEYNYQNLEELLEYYLDVNHVDERIAIAEAGNRLVANHSYADHLRRLLDKVLPEFTSWKKSEPASQRRQTGSTADKTLNTVRQWLTCLTPACIPLAHGICEQYGGKEAALLDCRALSEWSRLALAPADRARLSSAALQRASNMVAENPDGADCWAAFAAGALASTDFNAIERTTVGLCDAVWSSSDLPYPPLNPRTMDEFDVAEEECWLNHANHPEQLATVLKSLLLARLNAVSAERHLAAGRLNDALGAAETAFEQFPTSVSIGHLAGRCFRALGRVNDAMVHFLTALDRNPFHWQCRAEAVTLALETTDVTTARNLLADWETIIKAIPVYQHTKDVLTHMINDLAAVEAQAEQSNVPKHLMIISFDSPLHWQQPITSYIQDRDKCGTALLLLRAEPHSGVTESTIRSAIANVVQASAAADALPPIVVITQPIPTVDRWKLFRGCSLVIDTPAISGLDRLLAKCQDIPLSHSSTINQYVAA